MTITFTDLFCGAGGSSLGATTAGLQLTMAANHWQTAIDVHQAHFPNAAHDCADISQADPRRYPATNILLASPECTNHSQARGVSRRRQDPTLWDAPDPAAERSRATMWDVPRFAEQITYDAVVVENVVEATKWVLFPAWWAAMEALGYRGQILSRNSMFHDVPQSRDRIYIVWTRQGLNVDFEHTSVAHCGTCATTTRCSQAFKPGRTTGRYRSQWVWRCSTCRNTVEPSTRGADQIIDWNVDCPAIGTRTKPLSPNTRARIAAGLARYGWNTPITTIGAGNGHERTPGNRARPVAAPIATQTTTASTALAVPAFAMNTATGQITSSARSMKAPIGTISAGALNHGLLMRNQTQRTGQTTGHLTTPTTEPARTITTINSQSLLTPTAPTADLETLVDECGFRMLTPYEVAAAMAFPTGYIPRDITKKDQVKLAGNAVTPPVMEWICERLRTALEAA